MRRVRSPAHLRWVRSLPCAACGRAWEDCDPAHVRIGTQGGMGLKPGDQWTIPLCHPCHLEQHRIGERSFAARHGLDPKALAERVWNASPHRC